jgi:hypothetical protein
MKNQAWRKAFILLSIGGCSFVTMFNGFNCGLNTDFTKFFQTSGSAAIDAISDSPLVNDNKANSDYDLIARAPATAFVKALWNEWVYVSFPQDPPIGAIVKP